MNSTQKIIYSGSLIKKSMYVVMYIPIISPYAAATTIAYASSPKANFLTFSFNSYLFVYYLLLLKYLKLFYSFYELILDSKFRIFKADYFVMKDLYQFKKKVGNRHVLFSYIQYSPL